MADRPDALQDLLHRVNNLLGTIMTQVEVARIAGTADACQQALRSIADSAQRTQAEVQRFRAGSQLKGPHRPADH